MRDAGHRMTAQPTAERRTDLHLGNGAQGGWVVESASMQWSVTATAARVSLTLARAAITNTEQVEQQ